MKFFDVTKIYVKAGNGGSGCLSFRREKFIPKGGPDGGDGGTGGNVYIKTDHHLNTLVDFRSQVHFKAKNGMPGLGKCMAGKNGDDIELSVPLGTQVFDENGELLLYDLTKDNQKICIATGGSGGRGNYRFKTSTNRAPREIEEGKAGEERWVVLKLKIIADIGIIGLPNAGKSTFLSVSTKARPKIASYPFTTLIPQLGVLYYKNKEFILADIPGLIEDAHKGKGLGHQFLAHIERCKLILHLIDATQDNVIEKYETIKKELNLYNKKLLEKKEIIVLSKGELLDKDELLSKKNELEKYTKEKVYMISSLENIGLENIYNKFIDLVSAP